VTAPGPPPRGALRRAWKRLPRAFPYLRPYWKQAGCSIALTALLAALTLAEPWPLAFIVDTVLGHKRAPGWVTGIVGHNNGARIALAVVGSLLITLLAGGLTVVNEYLTTTVNLRMILDFRSVMFRHAHRLSLSYHDETRSGVTLYRINAQAGSIGPIVTSLPDLVQSLLTLVGMAWIVFRIDPVLAAVALAVVPVIAYSTNYYANRIEPDLLRVRALEGFNLAIVHEAMAMLRVIVAFGRERHEYDRFRQQGEQTVDARVRLTVRQTLFTLAVSLATAVGTAGVLGLGAARVLSGDLTPGQLLVILAYIASVYGPLETLTTTLSNYQGLFVEFDHALELIDHPLEIDDKPGATDIGRARGDVSFDRVGFSYASRQGVLKGVSFRVGAGRSVAIVGPTGAGKSTLVSLLPRFYDPQQGTISIDGRDVGDVTLRSLRAQFSIVLQEPVLFTGSIAENIRYGNPSCDPDEVVEAAKAANAHDFIMKLPQQYSTVLGERGVKISGGERQRIAVARAFLRDAPILILDEPTSSIDSRTEEVILDALDRLMVGRTTIMIAHRLSTVRHVDEILVLDHGEIVQRGVHDELVVEPGLYRELWEAQLRVPRRGREVALRALAQRL
jgi:ABC-type multidrug transport system fused ATPase/permease subunit